MASRTGERTLRFAGGWARVGPWHDQPDVAHVVVATDQRLSAPAVRDCIARVRAAGYRAAVTSPLTAAAAVPFLSEGFEPREKLHVLEHPLTDLARPAGPGPHLRRGWRRDRPEVVALDRRAFPPDWQLGDSGLREALRATPSVRFRVADRPGDERIVAFAVTGRAGRQGYLQRLAVDPDARRGGLGRTLVVDALRWVRRTGARSCLVNTQADNQDALALYEACGFRQLPSGLGVLGCAW
ncbi:MAG TPA: GNAT family N-acetyltransferase [Acidimicrobiia bacterium]|nr:GNAT family N-acetyltransferase [Acidimicrobiia bacterium]HWW45278.1 GNAT family N-acetyltransferase [Acidimicrobiia bacterium]